MGTQAIGAFAGGGLNGFYVMLTTEGLMGWRSNFLINLVLKVFIKGDDCQTLMEMNHGRCFFYSNF